MDTFMGFIGAFGFSFPPRGWSWCAGQLVAISDNQALFSLLSDHFGGDARTSFGLPDLRGRAPVAQGEGPGQPIYTLGERVGATTRVLSVGQMPSHTHDAVVVGGQVDVSADLYVSTEDGQTVIADPGDYIAASIKSRSDKNLTFVPSASKGVVVPIGGLEVDAVGGKPTVVNSETGNDLQFSVMQPIIALNFSIAMQGLYPSRN